MLCPFSSPTILTVASSSWKKPQKRLLEKGNKKGNQNHAYGDASTGVQGVQHASSAKKRKRRPDLELDEGGAGEDDDPDE